MLLHIDVLLVVLLLIVLRSPNFQLLQSLAVRFAGTDYLINKICQLLNLCLDISQLVVRVRKLTTHEILEGVEILLDFHFDRFDFHVAARVRFRHSERWKCIFLIRNCSTIDPCCLQVNKIIYKFINLISKAFPAVVLLGVGSRRALVKLLLQVPPFDLAR